MKWSLHKIILAYCIQCGKKKAHELGHFHGRRGLFTICLGCRFTTEVDNEKATR